LEMLVTLTIPGVARITSQTHLLQFENIISIENTYA
jgi:hypothetical protein